MRTPRRAWWWGAALATVVGAAAGSACGKHKVPPPVAAPVQCNTNDDCPARWVCLAHECANPSTNAYIQQPSTAVTPDKVGRQVEQIDKEHEERVDKVTHPE